MTTCPSGYESLGVSNAISLGTACEICAAGWYLSGVL